MRHKTLIFSFILLSLFGCAQKNEAWEKSEKKINAHPRLLWTKARSRNILSGIQTDSTWNAVHQLILDECKKLAEKPQPTYKLEGIRLLSVARESRKRIFYFSYAYRTTGDTFFLNEAEKVLNTISDFPDWNPGHFLDVAELTWAAAIGYDWLYEGLSESTRKKLSEAIIEKGLKPSLEKEYNFWLKEATNWNQVCNASMAFGALAIYDLDPKLASGIISRALESIQITMRTYEPDGASLEGYNYWSYGTTFNVYLIDAMEEAFGNDFGLMKNPGFFKSASYITNIIGPTELNYNYSDSRTQCMFSPTMFWFAEKRKDYSLLISEYKLLKRKDDLPWQHDLPALMLWGNGIPKNGIPEPKKLIWTAAGENPVSFLRSSWKSDGIFLGLKAGSGKNSHAHLDAGSFVLDAFGVRWVEDPGTQSYGPLEGAGLKIWSNQQTSDRWKVFRFNNFSHSTLTVNDELQNATGFAPIIKTIENDNRVAALVDLTEIYQNQLKAAKRGILIGDKKFIQVQDELVGGTAPATIRWSIPTFASVTQLNKSEVLLTRNNKEMLVKILEPLNAEFFIEPATGNEKYDEENTGMSLVYFKINLAPESAATIKVSFSEYGTEVIPVNLSLSNWIQPRKH
jgi:hypothetical protein